MEELRFSRRTVVAAAEVMEDELRTHASLTRELLKLDSRLAKRCDSGSLTDRFNHLINFSTKTQATALMTASCFGTSLSKRPFRCFAPLASDLRGMARRRKCKRLGLSFGTPLSATASWSPAARYDARSRSISTYRQHHREVERLLEKHAFTVPKGQLEQAIDAHARGNWAGANGQFRPFFEGLLDAIAARLSPSVGDSLRRLVSVGFIQHDLNERDFIQGLMKRLHPKGPHPGLSGDEDSTFRFHLVLLTARLLLTRFDTWGKT